MIFLVASWHRCFSLSSLSWAYSVASLLGVEITCRENPTHQVYADRERPLLYLRVEKRESSHH